MSFFLPTFAKNKKDMFRLKEAFAYAIEKGKIGKREKSKIANFLWGKSDVRSAYMNLLNMEKRRTKKIDIEMVEKLCNLLGVSADYLFGLSDVPNKGDCAERISEKAKEIIDLTQSI